MRIYPDEPINPDPNFGNTGTAGLTKREYFAAKAMQSLITQYEGKDSRQFLFDINDTIPKVAVMYADLLIKQLNKEEK